MIPVLARNDVEQFRTTVARRLGLQYEDGKLDFLAEVARRRMELLGGVPFESYLQRLNSSPKKSEELRALAEQLTVNESSFFRNADSFRAVAGTVLPARIRAKTQERQLRILSAGCAAGEEPYSLAALVREAIPDIKSWDVKVLGIDVNPAVLAKANQGRYSAWSLRSTPEHAKRRHFRAEGREFVLDPAIQKMVTFEERNLIDEDPLFWQSLRCDLVFCRNVLMYFTQEKAREALRCISQALLPGGFLFLGHAETLRGITQEFRLCHTHDTFYYQQPDDSDAPVATPAWVSTPRAEQAAASLPATVESTEPWVDVIRRACERIATLDASRAPPSAPEAAITPSGQVAAKAAARTWDLRLVLEAMRQERFAHALELVCSLPPDSHEDPEALLLRAVLLTNNGRIDESEKVCSRILALDGLHTGAHYLLALCREHASDSAGAAGHFQTAIYLDTSFAMPHLHLGIMARRRGDAATAQAELVQALSLLAHEDASRLLLFGGGFSRDTLMHLCRTELRAAGGEG